MIISHKDRLEYNEGIAIYFQPSIRRSIFVNGYSYGTGNRFTTNNYFLSFPSILFRHHYFITTATKKLRVYKTSVAFVENLESEVLYKTPFLNVSSDLECCISINDNFENIEQLCKISIEKFWATEFNDEIRDSNQDYKLSKKLLHDYAKWELKTKSEPSWVPTKEDFLISNYGWKYFFGDHFKHVDF